MSAIRSGQQVSTALRIAGPEKSRRIIILVIGISCDACRDLEICGGRCETKSQVTHLIRSVYVSC